MHARALMLKSVFQELNNEVACGRSDSVRIGDENELHIGDDGNYIGGPMPGCCIVPWLLLPASGEPGRIPAWMLCGSPSTIEDHKK